MTHNICFILLAVDKENNNDPLKIWGLYLFVLAFPGECVNQLGSEVKSIPERSTGWFKTLGVWHRLMLCDIKKNIFLLIWSLELIKPYHKLLHNSHVSSWSPIIQTLKFLMDQDLHNLKMLLVSACSCLCAIYWSQVLSREWRWCCSNLYLSDQQFNGPLECVLN